MTTRRWVWLWILLGVVLVSLQESPGQGTTRYEYTASPQGLEIEVFGLNQSDYIDTYVTSIPYCSHSSVRNVTAEGYMVSVFYPITEIPCFEVRQQFLFKIYINGVVKFSQTILKDEFEERPEAWYYEPYNWLWIGLIVLAVIFVGDQLYRTRDRWAFKRMMRRIDHKLAEIWDRKQQIRTKLLPQKQRDEIQKFITTSQQNYALHFCSDHPSYRVIAPLTLVNTTGTAQKGVHEIITVL